MSGTNRTNGKRATSDDVGHKKSSNSTPSYRQDYLTSESPEGQRTKADIGDIEGLATEAHLGQLEDTSVTPRKPRPSLSERTVETLVQVTTPQSVRRQKSNIAIPRSPVRPGSSQGMRSRSNSEDFGTEPPPTPKSTSLSRKSVSNLFEASTVAQVDKATLPTVPKQSPMSLRQSLGLVTTPSKLQPPRILSSAPSRTKSAQDEPSNNLSMTSLRTPVARRVVSRPSMNNLRSTPAPIIADGVSSARPTQLVRKSSSIVSKPTLAPKAPKLSVKAPIPAVEKPSDESEPALNKSLNSSQALREQIAKARAARKTNDTKKSSRDINTLPSGNSSSSVANFDYESMTADPFGQKSNSQGNAALLQQRIAAARTDGRLNISGMEFKEIPDAIMSMYDIESIPQDGEAWYESIDLVRFTAADNEIEKLAETIFPDINPAAEAEDEDFKGNQFGGVEAIDLHNNALMTLPLGLRRLERLVTLNLVR
jgi:hypothetical protein